MPLPNWLTQQQAPARSIKGLSEVRRLPRLGKIRLGIKILTGGKNEDGTPKTRPKEVEYFVCPPEVQSVYGEHPTKIKVMFPVSDREVVFPQALKRYGSSAGLKCRGNGNSAFEAQVDGTLKLRECPCHYIEESRNEQGKAIRAACSAVGNLMALLPEVSQVGVYQIDTGSVSNIITINSYLDYVTALLAPIRGFLSFAWAPLWLSREEREIQSVTHGLTKHWMLGLEIDEEWLRRLIVEKGLGLPVPAETREPISLAAPVDDGPDLAPGAVVEPKPEAPETGPLPPIAAPPSQPKETTTQKLDRHFGTGAEMTDTEKELAKLWEQIEQNSGERRLRNLRTLAEHREDLRDLKARLTWLKGVVGEEKKRKGEDAK